MSTYRIDAASGTLIKLKEYPMGRNPNCVEVVALPCVQPRRVMVPVAEPGGPLASMP